jgi:hypothetical protein
MKTRVQLSILINALYADEFDCTLCRNLLAQTEKQLKLIHFSLRLQETSEITCTTYSKENAYKENKHP